MENFAFLSEKIVTTYIFYMLYLFQSERVELTFMSDSRFGTFTLKLVFILCNEQEKRMT